MGVLYMFDQNRYRAGINQNMIPTRNNTKKRINGKFLKGPISLDDLSKVAALPGKTLATMIAIWILDSIHNGETFKLSMALLRKLSVGRNAAYSALKHLEDAGIITVDRLSGRLTLITMTERGGA